MNEGRRNFIIKSALTAGLASVGLPLSGESPKEKTVSVGPNPWLELSEEAYLKNAATISKLAGGKPVMAVLKNNGYGLGDVEVAQILNKSEHIAGMAFVKEKRALAVRKGGVTKPILLMGDFDESLGKELAESEITLSVCSADSFKKIKRLAKQTSKTVNVALYVDTGLGRMGIPYDQAQGLAEKVAATRGLNLAHTFSTLTTPKDYATEQIQKFNELVKTLESKGISVGQKHLAPSYSMLDLPNSFQDMVRPGILVHGSYPLAKMSIAEQFPLFPTYRMKAQVIRIEKLRKGESIGFSRFYKLEKDEWIATLPVGWADGYNSGAEEGAFVLVNDQLYRVVNVNASHTNLLIGDKKTVDIGDTATLIGPDRPEITPEGFGKLVGGHNYLQINYKESLPKLVHEKF